MLLYFYSISIYVCMYTYHTMYTMHVCTCKNNLYKHCINFLWALRTFLIPYSSSASSSSAASSAYVTHATISKVHSLHVYVCACSVCAPLFCLAALWSSFAFGVIEKPTKKTKTSHVVTRHAHTNVQTCTCTRTHRKLQGRCRREHLQLPLIPDAEAATAAAAEKGSCCCRRAAQTERESRARANKSAVEREWVRDWVQALLLRALSKWESALSIECKYAKKWNELR